MKEISVIVLTKNSQKYINKCICSILQQKYGNFEVIVVDAESTDRTKPIILNYECFSSVSFKVLNVPSNTSIGKARQIGIDNSNGEIIAFIDSDVELPHENWLRNMYEPFIEYPDIAGVQTLSKNRDNDPWILKHLHSGFEYKNNVIGIDNYEMVGTGHGLIRKELINRVGGFKDINSAEDINLTKRIMKLGYNFVYLPNEKVYHYHIDGWISYIKKHWILNKRKAIRRILFEGTEI